jgi:hypothetical protein
MSCPNYECRKCGAQGKSLSFATDNRATYGHVCDMCLLAMPREEREHYANGLANRHYGRDGDEVVVYALGKAQMNIRLSEAKFLLRRMPPKSAEAREQLERVIQEIEGGEEG